MADQSVSDITSSGVEGVAVSHELALDADALINR